VNSSLTFNGSVNTGGLPGNAWFEYGTDLNFGNSTTLNAFNWNSGYSGGYSTNVSGLTANTTYYFRAVAQNFYGRSEGAILSLATSGTATSPGSGNNAKNTAPNTPTPITSTDTVTVDKNVNISSLSSLLGAGAFGAGSFFPINLFGWLISFILILVLALLGKHAYRQFRK